MSSLVAVSRAVFGVAAHLLWPARCAACDVLVARAAAFCGPCENTLLAAEPACVRCALPLDVPNGGCSGCAGRSWPFDDAVAALVYGGAIADAIVGLKHAGRRHVARSLAAFVAPLLARAAAAGADAVLPVPLHPRKLRARGFNQALAVARAARPALPIWPDALVRTRDTAELGHAGPNERRERVAAAFAVRAPARVHGRHLVVLDDVMTTGATLAACAEALRAAGARRITVAALARAP